MLKGKAAYMAPEQALGRTDPRSDVFAMGIVLWEMLSGRRLFDGDALAILQRLLNEPIPRLRDAWPDADADAVDELVARALEKDPARRYQSANEMRQAIERHLRRTGQVAREPEVGEALSSAFADVRAERKARIQQAMAQKPAPAAAPGVPSAPKSRELPAVGGAPKSRGSHRRRRRACSARLAPLAARARAPRASARAAGRIDHRPPAATATPRRSPPPAADARDRRRRAGSPPRPPPRSSSSARAAAKCTAGHAAARPRPRRAPAAAPGSARAPCTEPIRVRVMYDMTGATKDVGTAAGKGEHDYLRALNEAGGIRGCRLDIDVQDTRYDKRTALEVYRAWRRAPTGPPSRPSSSRARR